ncbi:lipase family protein [Corynebacterium bovis]|uniref:lipase family protein n=1 Tax=Corynebacterium bovis TaxID=36808 RepID=UPI003139D9AB
MRKSVMSVAAAVSVAVGTVVIPVASAAPGSSVNGPQEGAPLGGSSVTRDAAGFFGNTIDVSGLNPGDIIDVRHLPYHAFGFSLPLDVVQIKYRTTDAQGRATYGVTSVVKPPVPQNDRVVSFHSVYDSLNPEHSPSRAIQGDVVFGTLVDSGETAAVAGFLAQGTTVVITDIEGQNANFAAGPEYGTTTLDALRAATAEPSTGIAPDAKIGLMGYSGGAIATNWAAQMAPSYAPEINDRLVGAATGGLLVDPLHNLEYIDGSRSWAGVMAMTIIGLTRAYGVDPEPYMSDYGRDLFHRMNRTSIGEVEGMYGGMTWASLVKPEYRDPRSVPEIVDVLNKVNLGQAPDPTVPFYFGQALGGEVDGTPDGGPNIGGGDGVMVAGDNRTLARKYCEAGVPVKYDEYPVLPHTPAFAVWFPAATIWLNARFEGRPAPSTCDAIPEGNDLSPETTVPQAPADGPQAQPQGSAGFRWGLTGSSNGALG